MDRSKGEGAKNNYPPRGSLIMADKAAVQDIATKGRQYALEAIDSVTLQDISESLESLLAVTTAGIPEIFRHYEFKIYSHMGKSRVIDRNVVPTMPWIAFEIVNDGAQPIYVDVNEKRDMQEHKICDGFKPDWFGAVKPHESKRFDMKYSGIHRVYLTVEPDKQTQVRIYSESKRHGNGPDLVDTIEGIVIK